MLRVSLTPGAGGTVRADRRAILRLVDPALPLVPLRAQPDRALANTSPTNSAWNESLESAYVLASCQWTEISLPPVATTMSRPVR